MKCRVIKGPVDGVAAGGVVDLTDNHANRALITGGVLEALDHLPPEPPPKAPKAPSKSDRAEVERLQREFHGAWDEEQKRHNEELAHLREGFAARLAEAQASADALRAERDQLAARLAEVEKAAKPPKAKKGETDPAEKGEG